MSQRGSDNNSGRTRLPPDERRAQLLDVASSLLYERGVEAVRIPEIADRAGVTRPVVYRFFPSRQAVFVALLENLSRELHTHLEPVTSSRGGLERSLHDFALAICDSIEASGPGAWLLLGGAPVDEEVRELVVSVEEQLTTPWRDRVARALRREGHHVDVITSVLVTMSRAVLREWLRGEISRDEAAELLVRSVRAILREFRDEQAQA